MNDVGFAGHDALEVVLGHLLGGAVLGEDALLVGPGKVAIELSVVAPQAKVVDRDGDQLVVEDGQVGERLVPPSWMPGTCMMGCMYAENGKLGTQVLPEDS